MKAFKIKPEKTLGELITYMTMYTAKAYDLLSLIVDC